MKKILIFLLFLCFALFAVACTTIDLDLQKIKGDSSFSSILENSVTESETSEEQSIKESSVFESDSAEESSEKGVFDDEYWSERR